MAQIIYDLVDPAELTGYVRAFDNEVLKNKFTLDQILPNRNVEDIEFRVKTGALADVDAAEYRAFDTQPAMAGRPGITRKRGELPPVSRQIPLTEEQTLRLRALERGTNDPIVTAIFDDSERMIRAVQARIELARGDALVDGIVTIAENDMFVTIDYGMPASHKVTAPIAWTVANKATAKPITDLLGWIDTYVDTVGSPPRGMMMSRRRLAGLLVNAEVLAFAAAGGTTPQRINLATLSDIFSDQGIPPITAPIGADPLNSGPFFDETVKVAGVQTRVIGDQYLIFLPPGDEKMGETFYGLTAEATRLIEKNLIVASDAPGIVALALQNDNPVQTFTLATAIALPVIPNSELMFTANVG